MDVSLAAPSPTVYTLFIDNQYQEEREDNDSELSSATHWETRLDLQVNNTLQTNGPTQGHTRIERCSNIQFSFPDSPSLISPS